MSEKIKNLQDRLIATDSNDTDALMEIALELRTAIQEHLEQIRKELILMIDKTPSCNAAD